MINGEWVEMREKWNSLVYYIGIIDNGFEDCLTKRCIEIDFSKFISLNNDFLQIDTLYAYPRYPEL
jgi:hypothetical protein